MKLTSDTLRCWRVWPVTHTFVHEWNEPSCIYSQPQSIIAPWPIFTVPQKVAGWVGLGGWLHTEMVCLPDSHPSQYQPTDSAAAGDRTIRPIESQVRRPDHYITELCYAPSFIIIALWRLLQGPCWGAAIFIQRRGPVRCKKVKVRASHTL